MPVPTLTIKSLNLPFKPIGGFLGLPRELRDLVYTFCVVEPSRLDRQHGPFCSYVQTNSKDPEVPPFAIGDPAYRPSTSLLPGKVREPCTCVQRQGANVLRASRQLHQEAARIFWSRNTFTFRNPADFNECVGDNLRLEYRPLIRHVTMLDYTRDDYRPYENSSLWAYTQAEKRKRAWAILQTLSALRTLEIRPDLFSKHEAELQSLKTALRHLRSLRIVSFQVYEYPDPARLRLPPRKRPKIYVKAALEVPLLGDRVDTKEFLRGYEFNFLLHLKHAMEHQLLGTWGGRPDLAPPPPLIRAAEAGGCSDVRNRPALRLRDGTVNRPPIYGLPASRATQRARGHARAWDAHRRRLAGLPTLQEEKLMRLAEEARRKKKERAAEEAEEREARRFQHRLDAMRARGKRRDEERTTAQRLQASERSASIREAVETRRAERRRVNRGIIPEAG